MRHKCLDDIFHVHWVNKCRHTPNLQSILFHLYLYTCYFVGIHKTHVWGGMWDKLRKFKLRKKPSPILVVLTDKIILGAKKNLEHR